MKPILLINGKKKCPKCGIEKEKIAFSEDVKTPSGLRCRCKKCEILSTQKWQLKNKKKVRDNNKKWRIQNAEYNKERIKKWRDENSEHCLEYNRKRHIENVEYEREYNKKRCAENPERIKAIMKKSNAKRNGTLKGKLNNSVRSRMNESLRKGTKAGRHWETLVKFTIDRLKRHLEKLFTPEMTWDNYGTYWHIDHKIPIAVFNFEKPEHIDFQLCWSLKNLQPLQATKNISKGCKLSKPFQPSLAMAVGG